MTPITDDTPATLAQHKVQAGDVVKDLDGMSGVIASGENGAEIRFDNGSVFQLAESVCRYTVVSRATPAPLPHGHVRLSDGKVVDLTADKMLPFGQLDAETQKAMRAHGGPYQMYRGAGWRQNPIPSFVPDMAYRVAPLPPVPKVETVTLDGWMQQDGGVVRHPLDAGPDAVKVTITHARIDGKIVPAGYKLEARP